MDAVQPNERRERKDAQRNLERVLSAAHELLAERGADVTMEDVARRAGVGVGTIYRRFPSKDLLFAAVSYAACADTHHCLQEAAQAERDPLLKLRALVLVQYHRYQSQAALLDLRQPAELARELAGPPDRAVLGRQRIMWARARRRHRPLLDARLHRPVDDDRGRSRLLRKILDQVFGQRLDLEGSALTASGAASPGGAAPPNVRRASPG